jgi:putative isomerase
MDRYSEMLKDYIHDNCHQMTREPSGNLRYPYTVPCSPQSPYYAMSLWDWDSWLISIVLGQVEVDLSQPGRFFAHEQGAILNFLDHADTKGRVPIHISEQGQLTRRRPGGDKPVENMHKPVLAQHAAALVWRSGKIDWLLPVLPKIEAFLNRYEADYTQSDTGLLIWVDDFAVGVDNDPSVYYRPDSSCGSIYLNSLYYRELLAFAALMERSGNNSKAVAWRAKAGHLANAINAYCWDERDGTYYSVDFALRAVDSQDWLHQGAPRSWPCLLLRIDSWSSFYRFGPVWHRLSKPKGWFNGC